MPHVFQVFRPAKTCGTRAFNSFEELGSADGRGSGAILGVRVRGGLAGARRVLERVRIFDYMVNVGDTKSMIVHPATSIHHGLPREEQERAGVFEDTLRLSVGTEDAGDLIRDLAQALEGAAPTAD